MRVIDLSDSTVVLVLAGFCAAEAIFLVALMRLFWTGSAPADRPGAVRAGGYLGRFGLVPGALLCFVVFAALTALLAVPGGFLAAVVGWWVAALGLFGLTVRQAFKANIALGLLNFALIVGLGAALGGS